MNEKYAPLYKNKIGNFIFSDSSKLRYLTLNEILQDLPKFLETTRKESQLKGLNPDKAYVDFEELHVLGETKNASGVIPYGRTTGLVFRMYAENPDEIIRITGGGKERKQEKFSISSLINGKK